MNKIKKLLCKKCNLVLEVEKDYNILECPLCYSELEKIKQDIIGERF